jgi:reverse gyrase
MATPIENARKRLASIRAEAEEIERFIAMYERFEKNAMARLDPLPSGNSEETYPQNSLSVNIGDNSRRSAHKGLRPAQIAEMMERLIREVGRPMTRGEIVDAFDSRDFEIPAKDKGRYLGTIAWRNKGKFINIEGRGYWLRGAPLMTNEPSSHLFSDVDE